MSSLVNPSRFVQELLESTRIISVECGCYAPDVPVINNDDELNEDECFDPGGGEINVEVDNSFTFVIQTFLPYLTYPEDSPLLLSTRSEDTIFEPWHLHLEPVAFYRDGTFMIDPNISEDSRVGVYSGPSTASPSLCLPLVWEFRYPRFIID
ncbi:hypothetical protein Tco_0813040 [Tanacetum coccineum]